MATKMRHAEVDIHRQLRRHRNLRRQQPFGMRNGVAQRQQSVGSAYGESVP